MFIVLFFNVETLVRTSGIFKFTKNDTTHAYLASVDLFSIDLSTS